MKVAVIGAGLSGLVCASKLLENGFEVHVFEREKNAGGLAAYTSIDEYRFPKTYHHVLRSDRPLNDALRHFGIAVNWRNIKVGFYAGSKIFPFSGPLDLMRFSPLSLLDRFRLGWLVMNTRYDEGLRDVTVREWVKSKAGECVYNNFVSPLISTYFGSSEGIAAAYLARRWSDESKYASNSLGFADFPKLIDSYVEEIASKNGLLRINSNVRAIEIRKSGVEVTTDDKENFEAIIITCPPPESVQLLREVSTDLIGQFEAVKYRAYICLVLRLEEKISNYYWVNILDRDIPFIACFEHANLNQSLNGGLVYTVAYVSEADRLWFMNDDVIYELFKDSLKKIFKKLPKVIGWKLFRERYGTPIYNVGYRNMGTNPLPRLYLAGVYMAFPDIRSSGPAIRTGIEAAEKLIQDFV